ncbi:hypothetical protein H072_179 [Dactylellina haptotyla CBS 200.50]|uniref:Protein kinase domain-containing protein n=1 Tax=Dactylellina haptotyla (strain CBS 200.50) TaxID=1284197 RepID=S8AY08_DACHA|nr:hypothetical protein H072_179 [Dactylellina haptotyla CBS 200.50]
MDVITNIDLVAKTEHSTISKTEHNGQVAVVKRSLRRDSQTTARFAQEVSLLESAGSHRNITTLLGSSSDDLSIILTYHPGRALSDIIDDNTKRCTLTPSDGAKIFTQISSALAFLHGKNIMHDDVKPENIVYDPHAQNAVLVDFGAALRAEEDGTVEFNPSGTPPYAPPEFLQRRKSMKGDVWAFGVSMLFVMGYIRLPDGEWILPYVFEDVEMKEEMETWLQEVESWREKARRDQIENVLGEMLESEPEKRIYSLELCRLLAGEAVMD